MMGTQDAVLENEAVNEEQNEQEQMQQNSDDANLNNQSGNELENDGVVITIGDQPEEQSQEESQAAPDWVKELRQNYKEQKRRNRELEEQLKQYQQRKQEVLGEKPTLEGCGYDEAEFATKLEQYYEKKRVIEAKQQEQKAEQEKQAKQWQDRQELYGKTKAELKVPDYDDAEDAVMSMLDVNQQGIIVHGADNPALVVYALGKNPEKLKELAATKDHIQFAVAIGKLTKDIVMKPRKSPPPPTPKVNGSGSLVGAVDGTLERLRAEAEQSGDYTKVMQYKRQLRAKA